MTAMTNASRANHKGADPNEKRLTARSIGLGPTARVNVQGIITSRGPRLDIRTYFLPGDGATDEWLPTKKGVRLDTEMIPTLIEHIEAAQREIDDEVAVGKARS